MFTQSRRRATAAAALTTAVLAALTSCGGGGDDGGGGGGKNLTVWIEEDLPDRVAATQDIVDAFTKKTGIKVKLVAVAEDQFNQILTSNAAAGKLPDVIGGLPLGQVRTLSTNKLIDTDAVGSVVDDLDRGTFNDSASSSPRTARTSWPCRASPGCSCWSTARTSSRRRGCPPPRRTTT
jgi:multiple sugar transport system substrate-binding protein